MGFGWQVYWIDYGGVRQFRNTLTPCIILMISGWHLGIKLTELGWQVYWIDYGGVRRFRNTLMPGEMYMERSYASHPWLVRSNAIDQIGKVGLTEVHDPPFHQCTITYPDLLV
jgi:hypothetical protein